MGLYITLAVLAGIALLVFAIAMIRISVTVTVDAALSVKLKIFCFTVPLVPGKEKKIRLKDFEIKRFRRRLKKEKEKERRKAEKKKKQEEKQKQKKGAEEKGKEKKKQFSLSELPKLISLAKKLIGCLGRHVRRDIRIRLSLLDIRVGSGDAAKTAELFGVISQSVSYLLTLLSETMHLELPDDAVLSAKPDFLAEKTELRLHCTVWLRVHHVVSLLFGLLLTYLRQ